MKRVSLLTVFFYIFGVMAPVFFSVMSSGEIEAATLYRLERFDSQLRQGVLYSKFKLRVGSSPVAAYVVQIALSQADLQVRPILAKDRLDSLETTPSMAQRTNALAAINGSFFNRSSRDPFPIGFMMINGRTDYFSHTHRSAFGLTRDKAPLFGYPRTRAIVYFERTGEYFFLWGMNRKRSKNEALVYTPEYGWRTGTNTSGKEIVVDNDIVAGTGTGNSAIPRNGFVVSLHGDNLRYAGWFHKGEPVKLYFVVDPSWLDVHNAITGGPLLLKSGQVALGNSASERVKHGYYDRIPVTAVGSTANGQLLFVVVDGRRRGYSAGMTYAELASFMRSLGAINAIGMDGGGSSTLYIRGKGVVNRPSDGSSRRVSNAIGLFETRF